MNATILRRRYYLRLFRVIADDTTGVSFVRQTFLLFGTFYVNKIPLFVPLRAFCDVGNSGINNISEGVSRSCHYEWSDDQSGSGFQEPSLLLLQNQWQINISPPYLSISELTLIILSPS